MNYKEYFTSLRFLHCKIYTRRAKRGDDIYCGPIFQVGFRIWPATCFEFDRPGLVRRGKGKVESMRRSSVGFVVYGKNHWRALVNTLWTFGFRYRRGISSSLTDWLLLKKDPSPWNLSDVSYKIHSYIFWYIRPTGFHMLSGHTSSCIAEAEMQI